MAWLLAVVLWITWTPPVLRDEAVFPRWGPTGDPGEIILNLALLMPLAVAIGAMTSGLRGRRYTMALLALPVIPCLIEAGQMWIGRRTPSFIDVAANATGAISAAVLGRALTRRGVRPDRLLSTAVAATTVAVVILTLGSVGRISDLTRLEGWRPEFLIASGDEVGGGRPFSGRVDHARVCAGAPADAVCAGPTAGAEVRRRLTERALRTQRVSLLAEVVSGGEQRGPARIVTFSESPGARNVTLAQQGSDLILRIRSELHGPNGALYAYTAVDAVPHGVPVHVNAVYRDGAVEMLVHDERVRRHARFHWTPLNAWLSWHSGDALTVPLLDRSAVLAALVLFLPVGFVLGRRYPRSRGATAAGAAAIGVVIVALAGLAPGLHVATRDLVLGGACCALGAVIPHLGGSG